MAGVDLPAVGYAAGAALIFAVANNLQRGAAAVVPVEAGGPVRLFLKLLRAPRWVAGSTLALAALGLHAVALARGGVILVQAVLAAGLVLSLAIEAARERRWMRHGELLGSVVLVVGVIVLLGYGQPGGGKPVDTGVQLTAAIALAVVAAIGLSASRVRRRPNRSAVIMGAAAGACFALDAVFLKGVANWVDDLDALPVATGLAGFVIASLLGNLIIQRAFQRAPLRLVLPTVTAGDPVAAFGAGRWMLREHLQGGSDAHTAVILGLAAIAVGIITTTVAHPRG